MLYLIITEDREVFETNNITEDEMNGCDSGVLDIIDIVKGKIYYESEWHRLRKWNEI